MEIDEAHTQSVATPEKWRKSISKVFKAVVLLRVTATRDFDTEKAGVTNATGFIVDKQRGIILTNRHVVQSGPVDADATFPNRQNIPVYPLYRDPVHDFGFFRFDPSALKFMELEEIPLAPEAAAVGLEIRLVGNGSEEMLSVFAGTIARLDRHASLYTTDGYNDFNTFYMQAALGTKRGSSGSPVIDCDGQAVGLNAAGTNGSAAFFLPLDRVARALKILQRCKDESNIGWQAAHIPRGTLQMTLSHNGFHEALRLGLPREVEELVRKDLPAETGFLVIRSMVLGGPAQNHLRIWDVLVRVNGDFVTRFLKLETVLDDNVGKTIDIEVVRGGVLEKVSLKVQDLHSITPSNFLELSGGVIHPLSYQQARNFLLRCGTLYVAKPGYMLSTAGVPPHAIIKSLAGKEITRLEDFISILSKLRRGVRVPLEFMTRENRHRICCALVTVDRHEWYAEPELYSRNDVTGLWERTPVMSVLSTRLDPGRTKSRRMKKQAEPGGVPIIKSSSAQQIIESSLVMVEVHVPPSSLLDGAQMNPLSQTGVVVYHDGAMGIVAVDRNTVATPVADVMLAFAAYPMEIPGQVVFLHPVHNYALVAYDPDALGAAGITKVRAAALLPEPSLNRGDAVYLVGLSPSLQTRSRKSYVTNPRVSLNIGPADIPRYRAMNMDVIEIESDFGSTFSGVLVDEKGRVQALRCSFYNSSRTEIPFVLGVPIYTVSQVLEKIINGNVDSPGSRLVFNGIKIYMPLLRILEVHLCSILLSKARGFGLSDKWITKLANKDPISRHVLRVECCFAGSRAEGKVQTGDMVLAINGKPITSYRDVENACQLLDESNDEQGNLRMTIWRKGEEIKVLVGTDVRSGFGSTHMVNWCGYIIQETHSAVRSLGFWPDQGHGVYLSGVSDGSPAHTYGVPPAGWIVQVNEKPTPDLQTFVNVTKEIDQGDLVIVRTLDLHGNGHVVTVKQDLHYWPTWELKFDPETATWKRTTIKTCFCEAVRTLLAYVEV